MAPSGPVLHFALTPMPIPAFSERVSRENTLFRRQRKRSSSVLSCGLAPGVRLGREPEKLSCLTSSALLGVAKRSGPGRHRVHAVLAEVTLAGFAGPPPHRARVVSDAGAYVPGGQRASSRRAALTRSFRGAARPSGEVSSLPCLYGPDFRRESHLARFRPCSNGETVSVAYRVGRTCWDGARARSGRRRSARPGPPGAGCWRGGASALWARTAARDRSPASSLDAASLLRRRLLHTGHARDAQPRHLFPQVSALARRRSQGHVRMRLSGPPRGATTAHAPRRQARQWEGRGA